LNRRIALLAVIAFILIIFMSGLLSGCKPSEEELNSRYGKLTKQVASLESNHSSLKTQITSLSNEHSNLLKDKAVLEHIKSGRSVRYYVQVKLKQERFSLDIGKHLKDKMNAVDFWLPVSRDYFQSYSIGDKLLDKDREGSFWMEGSHSSWVIKVIDKKVEYL